jgi:hypothetical protein
MAEVKYKIASGEPTRKWKASAGTGLGVGLPLTVVLGYIVGRVDPTMPPEVQGAAVALAAWAITQGAMMIAGWLARPGKDDAPVVDPASVPPRARRIPPD